MIATAKDPSSHQRIPTSGGQHQARTSQFEPLKVEYNELERLARQIDQALATIPFTRWRLPKYPRAVGVPTPGGCIQRAPGGVEGEPRPGHYPDG